MFRDSGIPHDHCQELWKALDAMSRTDIKAMQERAERSFLHEGITFAVYGDESAQERIIPIDLLPGYSTPGPGISSSGDCASGSRP